MWKNDPPTKPGYYYLLQEGGKERIGKLNDYDVWSIDGTLLGYSKDLIELNFKFGSRIPDHEMYNAMFDYWLLKKIDENSKKREVGWDILRRQIDGN